MRRTAPAFVSDPDAPPAALTLPARRLLTLVVVAAHAGLAAALLQPRTPAPLPPPAPTLTVDLLAPPRAAMPPAAPAVPAARPPTARPAVPAPRPAPLTAAATPSPPVEPAAPAAPAAVAAAASGMPPVAAAASALAGPPHVALAPDTLGPGPQQRPAAPTGPARDLPASAIAYRDPPAPVYPRASRRAGEAGLVVVRVFVDEAGLPRALQIVQSSGHARLDAAASDAVQQARFHPPTDQGRPTAGWARIPIPFELEKLP